MVFLQFLKVSEYLQVRTFQKFLILKKLPASYFCNSQKFPKVFLRFSKDFYAIAVLIHKNNIIYYYNKILFLITT